MPLAPRRRPVLNEPLARWSGRSVRLLAGAGLLASSVAVGVLATGPGAGAAPGTPGAPQAGITVFVEDFENGSTNTAAGAQSYSAPDSLTYTGAGGRTFTGSPSWINGARCNGVILSYANSTTPVWAQSGDTEPTSGPNGRCSDADSVRSFEFLRMLALAMGQQFAPAAPTTAHVVSSYTECQSSTYSGGQCDTLPAGPANGVMFQTAQPIAVTPGNFYAFGVKTATINCGSASFNPQYQFAVTLGGESTTLGNPLDACQGASTANVTAYSQSVTHDVGGDFGTVSRTVQINDMVTDASVLAQPGQTSADIVMWNTNGSTYGNDGAFDDVRLVDVTPQLDKSFAPASVPAGGVSTFTLTITNTSELAQKAGWSFTDTLPAGLVVAGAPIGGTCAATVAAPAGGSTIAVSAGSLAAGEASCTITVPVTSSAVASYTSGAAEVSASIGVNAPGSATVEFGAATTAPATTAPATTAPTTTAPVTTGPAATASTPGGGSQLAATGSSRTAGLVGAGLATLLIGGALLGIGRQRQRLHR